MQEEQTNQPALTDWEFQKELDILVKSGFAVYDEQWTEMVWKRGAIQDKKPTYHRYYKWTPEGRVACFRYQHTTPMAWAEQWHLNHLRHCVVCGKDCYKKKVWAQDYEFRCVCVACGAKGHGLKDILKEEEANANYRHA